MVVVVDPAQEPIKPSVTRTKNPPADTPVPTGVRRDRSLADYVAGAVEVDLVSHIYGEQRSVTGMGNSAVKKEGGGGMGTRTVTPQLYIRFPFSVPLCTRDEMSVNSSHTVSPSDPWLAVMIWKAFD